ncbi:MAG: hypothetical protein LBI77_03225 [Puniceicoccales bacterium]|jgi:hypothetical protein|nr:hypothetical protein [Puniceicoccales bacterium]
MLKIAALFILFLGQNALWGWTMVNPSGEINPAAVRMMEALGIAVEPTAKSINAAMQDRFLRESCQKTHEIRSFNFKDKWEKILPYLREMSFVGAIFPDCKEINTLIFCGSSIPSMRAQIEFIRQIPNLKFNKIVFLTAHRILEKFPDGLDPLFSMVRTEHDAAVKLIEEYFSKDISVYFSNNPEFVEMAEGNRRPSNRADTVEKWLNEQNPDSKACLLVSVNPFINYQYETVVGLLKKRGWFLGEKNLFKCGPCILESGVHLSPIVNKIFKLYLSNLELVVGATLDTIAHCLFTEISNF